MITRRFLYRFALPAIGLLIVAGTIFQVRAARSLPFCADVAAVAPAVMRHRLGPNFAAQSDGVTPDDIVRKILEAIPQH